MLALIDMGAEPSLGSRGRFHTSHVRTTVLFGEKSGSGTRAARRRWGAERNC